MQQTGTGAGHYQYVRPKYSIKSCEKYMKVVEYWHGTIKIYRYDGDVSSVSPTLVELDSMNRVLSEDQKTITIPRCGF